VDGKDVDQTTLKELLRRKAITLKQWDPKLGTGLLSCPAPNNMDITVYFGAPIYDKTVPFSLVIPAKFGGMLRAKAESIEIQFAPPIPITFLAPIHEYAVPPINLNKMYIDATNIVYSASEIGAAGISWNVKINLR
jgi:hypothetical protein